MFITGWTTEPDSKYNMQSANLSVTFNSNAYSRYVTPIVPVVAPTGYIGVPMPNRLAFYHLTPNGTDGYIGGFINEMPDPEEATNNITGLVAGEAGITETSDFNFNIMVKLDGLKSKLKNVDENIIETTLPISENIVTILTDIIAEIVALENAYNQFVSRFNSHQHSQGTYVADTTPVTGTSGTSTTSASSYSATANFNEDKDFLNESPVGMYINVNGKKVR